jgi:hypothetical protein
VRSRFRVGRLCLHLACVCPPHPPLQALGRHLGVAGLPTFQLYAGSEGCVQAFTIPAKEFHLLRWAQLACCAVPVTLCAGSTGSHNCFARWWKGDCCRCTLSPAVQRRAGPLGCAALLPRPGAAAARLCRCQAPRASCGLKPEARAQEALFGACTLSGRLPWKAVLLLHMIFHQDSFTARLSSLTRALP